MSRKALGKGLKALIPPKSEAHDRIPLDRIEPNPYQPRRNFDEVKLDELASSIRQHGVLEPILVRPHGENFEIVMGERRFRASKLAGLTEIPAMVQDLSDEKMMQISLIENLQREDLNVVEEATGYRRLMDEFALTQEEVADVVGKQRSTVANTVRLLALEEPIVRYLAEGLLTRGHGKVLLGVESGAWRRRLAQRAVEDELSVRSLEKLVAAGQRNVPRGTFQQDPQVESIEERLREAFGTKVTLHYKKGRGRIEIQYFSDDELERILDLVNAQ